MVMCRRREHSTIFQPKVNSFHGAVSQPSQISPVVYFFLHIPYSFLGEEFLLSTRSQLL